MYYPIGWHKGLKLDTQNGQEQCNILSIQANHERELFLILSTRSIHLWNSRPAVEIACHRRSKDSIDSIGFNKSAAWRTDSSVIVVATERDQLLFYQVRKRVTPNSATNFLLPGHESDSLYRLKFDSKSLKGLLNRELNQLTKRDLRAITHEDEPIPALTIFSFGKLDLSSVGVSCLMSAEEELIVGSRNGDIYGVHWNGNIDDKFPWSLSRDVEKGSDYIVDLKFSSVLSGFALVFYSGRVGFMPLKATTSQEKSVQDDEDKKTNRGRTVEKQPRESRISYLSDVDNAICAEINHKYRLIAFGLKNSQVVVCNIDKANSSLVCNHKLEIESGKFPHDFTKLGSVKCMRYSPDSLTLITSWENGDFVLWSVFGSLLFCSQQWQLESKNDLLIKPVKICNLAWGREGYNLWLSIVREDLNEDKESVAESLNLTNGGQSQVSAKLDENIVRDALNSLDLGGESTEKEEILIMSFAHSSLSSSPHLSCCSDSIVLMSEDRLYVGPSVPHEDKFDHWIVIDLPQMYLNANYPIRYATVDRECKNLTVAGTQGFAIYSIELSRWKFFNKRMQQNFCVCGDIIWWTDYLVLSCYNLDNESFELRAYLTSEALDTEYSTIQATSMEIIRMSIFENRLLVLYSDGTLGMFMLNLRRRPNFSKLNRTASGRSDSIVSEIGNSTNSEQTKRKIRSDSIMSLNYPLKTKSEIFLQIFPIENLIISNLQANAYCISSIALTRLHFKNNRVDDSILLNACGKLFLLEREAPISLVQSTSSHNSPDLSSAGNSLNDDLSFDSQNRSIRDLDVKVNSAKQISTSIHFASASLKSTTTEPSVLSNVTFRAVSVIATNVEQFWISPEISNASELSYFKKSLWLFCGGSNQNNHLQVWLPLLNDKNDAPTDLYVPDRIMLPIRCDVYPLAIRSSSPDVIEPDDAIVLGAESDILYKDNRLFTHFPYTTVKRQCRVYLHRILRELLLNQHLGYYARKIAESCQSLPYFAHCFELLLHEVLEEEATSPVPLPDPMLPQIVRFIKEFPVYLETVVHCARKSELSMWSHLFDERAVGNPRRLFQECLEKHKLDIAASCLIILQSLDRNIVSQRMVKELIKAAKDDPEYNYLIEDLESFLSRAELDYEC